MWDKKVKHMIIIIIYVDDSRIIGKEEIIASLIDELKNHRFNLKVERNVNEYLSCCIEESKDEGKNYKFNRNSGTTLSNYPRIH
jgi:hypothetical protein